MDHKNSRQEAILVAKKILAASPIYLDTETTGMGYRDEVVEIAILEHDGSVVLDSLVKPIGKISSDAFAVHGITQEMVADAPTWGELWPEVEASLKDRVVAIYNAEFDNRMMMQSNRLHGLSWMPPYKDSFCIMNLYAQFYGQWNSYRKSYTWQSLDSARRQSSIEIPNTHRAKDDTLLARAVFHYMAGQEG